MCIVLVPSDRISQDRLPSCVTPIFLWKILVASPATATAITVSAIQNSEPLPTIGKFRVVGTADLVHLDYHGHPERGPAGPAKSSAPGTCFATALSQVPNRPRESY